LNKIRRLAEELVNRYPSIFGADFDKNKEALSQVTVVRTRSLRNQLAGAITKIVHERAPFVNATSENEVATIEERVQAEQSLGSHTKEDEAAEERSSSHETKDKESQPNKSSRDSAKAQAIEENAAVA
jgi:small subunit ribosomal protein S17e